MRQQEIDLRLLRIPRGQGCWEAAKARAVRRLDRHCGLGSLGRQAHRVRLDAIACPNVLVAGDECEKALLGGQLDDSEVLEIMTHYNDTASTSPLSSVSPLSATMTIHQVVPFLDTAIVFLTEELLSASQLHIEVIVSEVDCEFSELLELSPSGLWRRWGQLNSKTRFLWIHTSNSCSWPGC